MLETTSWSELKQTALWGKVGVPSKVHSSAIGSTL